MGIIDVGRSELAVMAFGTYSELDRMESAVPQTDRELILRREYSVRVEDGSMLIRPTGSENSISLRLSEWSKADNPDGPVVGMVFVHGEVPAPETDVAFCCFDTEVNLRDATIDRMAWMGCVYRSRFTMESAIVRGNMVLDGSRFEDEAVFIQLSCQRGVSLCHCIFEGRCDFNSAEFVGRAAFRSSLFKKSTDFKDVTFRNKALFDRMTYKNDDSVPQPSRFEGPVTFESARFDHYANFKETHFLGKTEFKSTVFNGKTFFEGTSDFKSQYNDVTFKSTRFGVYTCIADLLVGNFSFDAVTCQGELMLTGVQFDHGISINELISSGYTTIRNLTFKAERRTISIRDSTFNGDLDVGLMSTKECQDPMDVLSLRNCWVTGHFHLAGNLKAVDLEGSTFNGPLALDLQHGADGSDPVLSILNTTMNSSARFRWIVSKQVNEHPVADVESVMGCRDLFDSVSRWKQDSRTFTPEEMCGQMLTLRNAMARMGRFDDSDFFLREYNKHHRSQGGMRRLDGAAALVSRIGNRVARMFGGYGTMPGLILLWMVLVPTVIGCCIGYVRGDLLGGLLDGFVAFITMSLGVDTSGLADAEKVLLVIDGFIGVFLMSFFVTSMARKLFR